ncbi:MAG: UPF0104 family protein, partial [Polaromonas sp.]|nr:UPF0104 family protein [Polaromonas sp.]
MSRKAAAHTATRPRGIRGKAWWPWLKRGATLLFFTGVAWLLFEQAKAIEWQEVWSTLRGYPLPSLL